MYVKYANGTTALCWTTDEIMETLLAETSAIAKYRATEKGDELDRLVISIDEKALVEQQLKDLIAKLRRLFGKYAITSFVSSHTDIGDGKITDASGINFGDDAKNFGEPRMSKLNDICLNYIITSILGRWYINNGITDMQYTPESILSLIGDIKESVFYINKEYKNLRGSE